MLLAGAKKLFDRLRFDQSFAITYPDGVNTVYGADAPVFIIDFKTQKALTDTLLGGSLGFGEAFVRREIEVSGDLTQAIRLGFYVEKKKLSLSWLKQTRYAWGFYRRRNTVSGSKKNISAHYDLSNEFYQLWLDENMQYTCAYFHDDTDTLEQAQLQKMDLVCRKLRLKPGDLVVEAGCGWGGLALHMVRHYGVRVKAFNISQEQVNFARERQKKYGIGTDQLNYIIDDFRNIRQHVTECDNFASICMIEHIGRGKYSDLLDIIGDVLKPTGNAMIQFISRKAPARFPNTWLEKHVFPGYYNPSVLEFVETIEALNYPLQIVDLENMRYHYSLTTKHWWERLEANREKIRKLYDDENGEEVIRKYRLYLAGGCTDFCHGLGTLVYQLLLVRDHDNAAPLSRHHMLGVEPQSAVVDHPLAQHLELDTPMPAAQ